VISNLSLPVDFLKFCLFL
jgi:DnaJ family protein C protein 9